MIFIVAMMGYFMKIIPTSFGIHSKVYKSSSIAIEGYDVVNYYENKTAVKGNIKFSYKRNNTSWFFISKQNMRMFKNNPNKYIPKFGGYCVTSIGKGYTHPSDPKHWYLANGNLYLFSDEETKKIALVDWKNILADAKLHWK